MAGTIKALSYDANGNMTTSYDGRTMTYDGENRPLSVTTAGGVRTEYAYAADGTRLMKIENEGTPQETTTLTIGDVELRHFGDTSNEELLAYGHANVRLDLTLSEEVSYLHRDQLGSVRAITDAAGAHAKQSVYKPFGTVTDWQLIPGAAAETKGFIGERFDADAGLQYLNARYYDPELGIFIQPDWFEVTKAGVGTNRYGYSGNDPVNLRDPGGNSTDPNEDVDDKPKKNFWRDLWRDIKGSVNVGNGNASVGVSGNGYSGNYDDFSAGPPAFGSGYEIASRDWIRGANGVLKACTGKCGRILNQGLNPIDRFFKVHLRNAFDKVGQVFRGNSVPANTLNHVFQSKHQMDALVTHYGSREAAYRAIERSAIRAYKSGSIPVNSNGVVVGAQSGMHRINVGSFQVDIRGRVINGAFKLGNASMKLVP